MNQLHYQRHDLIWLDPEVDVGQLACQQHNETARNWMKQGFPLVIARQSDEQARESNQIVLGFTLPSTPSRTRVMFRANRNSIIRHSRPLKLDETIEFVPESWQNGLNHLAKMLERHGIVARVYGSLSSEIFTGMQYLDEASDLDLLMEIGEDTNLSTLLADLENFPFALPRIDGEILFPSGWAAAWRELATALRAKSPRQVLAKSFTEIRLISADDFARSILITA